MTTVHILGYHTCKTEGGWSYVKSESPFLSGSGSNQWLTQGYYFWSDSDYFAHKWGESSYDNDYAIVKCYIEIDGKLLLDLVGSVEAQLYFEKLLTKFRDKLKKLAPDNKEPSVNAVISYWRKVSEANIDVFPFVAIKAQDIYKNKNSLSFTGKAEKMHVGPCRQQLCLFENSSHLITKKEVIYPEGFKIRCTS